MAARRIALIALAVGGSLAYGASLPQWRVLQGALWLAACAGAAWLVFLPLLARITRVTLLTALDESLIAMAAGECVLLAGMTVNLLTITDWRFNAAVVACSNVVMAAVLARRLTHAGVPLRTTLALWFCVLDGCGLLFFFVAERSLRCPTC